MLGEYLDEVAKRRVTTATGEAARAAIGAAFTEGTNFLSNPKRFPNRLTNIIVGTMQRLLASKAIEVIIMDKTPNPDNISGIVALPTGNARSPYKASLLLSRNYHHLAKERPINALATVANLAAGVRTLKMTIRDHAQLPMDKFRQSQQISKEQASACTAGTIHTLTMMDRNEGLDLPVEPGVQLMADAYPEGFASLPPAVTHLRLGNGPGPMPVTTPLEVGFMADIEFTNLVNPPQAAALIVSGALTAKEAPSLVTAQQLLGAVDSSLHIHLDNSGALTAITLRRQGKATDECIANPRNYQRNLDRLRKYS